ncbi:MAG TPA: hypothetical protein VK152_02645 [Paludibacter sp.]|nr:hypothetical protein [Paludibacter sp.]
MKLLYTLVFVLVFVNPVVRADNASTSGLVFQSHSVLREQRTSLQLNKGNFLDLPDGFTLDFDIKFRNESFNYGYVFRIIAENDLSIDLLSNISNEKRTLDLVVGNHIDYSFGANILDKYRLGEWTHVSVQVAGNKIRIGFNGKTGTIAYRRELRGKYKFFFGAVNDKKFATTDVPTMALRKIRLLDARNKLVGFWELNRHADSGVYDSAHNLPAKALNPLWEIDSHTKWTQTANLKLPEFTQSAYDPHGNCFYFASKQHIVRYRVAENTFDTIHPTEGNPYIEKFNQLVFNPYKKQLWSYDFDKSIVSVYDFNLNRWSHSDLELKNPNYSQHNAFISPVDSGLYTFGGYGNYIYKNRIQHKGNEFSEWVAVDYNEKIPNRYLSGLGLVGNDSAIVFGGYGNPTGHQEYGANQYYDLYVMDLHRFKARKCWELKPAKENFVVGSSLVFYRRANAFFALCFSNTVSNSTMQLRSFGLADGETICYGDTLPMLFDDVKSYATLYLNGDSTMLYALASYNQPDHTRIKIYSIAFPPLTPRQTLQNRSRVGLYTLAGIVAILLVSLMVYARKLNSKKAKGKQSLLDNPANHDVVFAPAVKKTQSSILLLGGFHVWNKKGEEITDQFTPVLKQLLILILLYTKKNEKGISNSTLREFLWTDKSEESFLNNRRVSIHKLRSILDELEGVSLEKNNIFWSVKIGQQAYCDYYSAMDFLNLVSKHAPTTFHEICDFPLDILAEQLLPVSQKYWLDSFKADYSNKVLDTLMSLSKLDFVQGNSDAMIQFSNIMFVHDRTDEHALALKCKALVGKGKISLAKSVYQSFCIEYKTLLDEDYPKEFKEIVG